MAATSVTKKGHTSTKEQKPATATKPVASIVKKPSFIVPILVVIILVAASILIYLIAFNPARGSLVATVNGEPIYASDIDQTLQLLPAQYHTPAMREIVVNQTVDKVLLIQEARRRGIVVTDAEVNTNIERLLNDTGKSQNDLDKALKERNITREQYLNVMRDLMLIDRLGQEAVSSKVSVSENEIMDYYAQHQSEFLPPSGGRRISHILVKNMSAALEIIASLNDGESFAGLARKYTIDTATAASGGSLGIVSPGDPYVKPFLDAALALRENEYTRAPVQSQFGYHLILRSSDLQPLGDVRADIRSSLENVKDQAAFKALLDDLRATANIKYYTANGVVSPIKAEPRASLNDFASCVSSKSVVYGASWSPTFKEQQALFGEAWSLLTAVDCDTSASVCATANIQKYPTWIIGGKQYGKLALKEIAGYTGCSLPANS